MNFAAIKLVLLEINVQAFAILRFGLATLVILAIGHRACLAGHSVLYVQAHQMFTALRAARADGTYDRRLARYTSTPPRWKLWVVRSSMRPVRGLR